MPRWTYVARRRVVDRPGAVAQVSVALRCHVVSVSSKKPNLSTRSFCEIVTNALLDNSLYLLPRVMSNVYVCLCV